VTVWGWLWLAWGLLFAVIEAVAVVNDKRGDTLSEHLRMWFRTDTKHGRTAWLVVSGGFAAWFVVHILQEGLA
jgi:hypothetical protein